jgi:PIN domain nuclease of toxin-antitoxin system
VLDASAFLAYLQAEPGAETVQEALAQGCCISAVNWAEVISKVAELGKPSHEFVADLKSRRLLGAALRVVPFDEIDAPIVGDMRPQTRHLGLSLGDRACLTLGRRLGSPVLTTDRAWGKLDVDLEVEIRVIR